MTPGSLLATLRDTDMTLPLVCSLISSALTGGEREINGRPAHPCACLLCVGLMTLAGLRMAEWSVALPDGAQVVSDMARMPHAILTGIDFLGAGVIYREGASVQGLTTAASLWLTAALGIVFGTGLLELGTIGTVASLLVLVVLRILQRLAPQRPKVRVKFTVCAESSFGLVRPYALLGQHGLTAGPPTIRQRAGKRRCTALAGARGTNINCEVLAVAFQSDDLVQESSILPV